MGIQTVFCDGRRIMDMGEYYELPISVDSAPGSVTISKGIAERFYQAYGINICESRFSAKMELESNNARPDWLRDRSKMPYYEFGWLKSLDEIIAVERIEADRTEMKK